MQVHLCNLQSGSKEDKVMLKGNQKKIDANKNGKVDGGDFALLRGKKQVSKAKGKATKPAMNRKKGM
jgi:hypothetical protein